MLFTDTDNLCFETEEIFYEIVLNNKEFIGLSNFLKIGNDNNCDDNKKVPGKIKDEYGGIAIWVFVGTKSKCIQYLM